MKGKSSTQNSTKNPIRKLNFRKEEIEIRIKLYNSFVCDSCKSLIELDVALEFRSTLPCESLLYMLMLFDALSTIS